MAEPKMVTAAEIERRLRVSGSRPERESAAAAPPTPTRLRYRAAVAALSWFDVAALEGAHGPLADADVRALITSDCERVFTPRGTRWRLQSDVREETIRGLGTPAAVLDTFAGLRPDPADVSRTMIEAYLRGTAPPPDRQTVEQLHGTRQAAEVLAPLDLILPTPEQIENCLGLAELLDPLRVLLRPTFMGRERELGVITLYVHGHRGVHPARPRLVLHGPGGAGKSTLIARFVLDNVDQPHGRLPLAYLSFDRMDLNADQPLTLLAEAARQLGVLYPSAEIDGTRLEGSIRSTLRRLTAAGRGSTTGATTADSAGSDRDEMVFLDRFAHIVDGLPADSSTPVVWVLDTMEQVQRRGPLSVSRLWAFLDRLQSFCPRLRVIFAGRAPLEGHPGRSLPLTGFDDAQALAFLRHIVTSDRITDEFLHTVIQQVSTNPLSLKLAAELLQREGEEGFPEVADEQVLLARLSAEEVQGVLYRRILDRLEQPELRLIANPGLVLRRITPGVIQRVLAIPCGLGRLTYQRAVQLFDALSQEASLVEPVPGEIAVLHRADVRRSMLRLLQRDDPDAVRTIHQYAVDYYARRIGAQARAEELYHRLALGESEETLNRFWDPVAEPLLLNALDELPAASRAYLATRLGVPVDAETRRQADSEIWADQAIRAGRERIAGGDPAGAVEIVRERSSDRIDLIMVTVEALAADGRLTEALDYVADTLQNSAAEGGPRLLVRLLILGARIAEDVQRYELAVRWSRQARAIAEAGQLKVEGLTAGAAEARVYRRSGRSDLPAASALRNWLIEAIERFDRPERKRNPILVRDLAAEVGTDVPSLLVDAARLHGVDIEGVAGSILAATLGDEQLRTTITSGDDDQPWKRHTTTAEAGIGISDYLRAEPDQLDTWARPLSDAYKAEVDQATYPRSNEDEGRS